MSFIAHCVKLDIAPPVSSLAPTLLIVEDDLLVRVTVGDFLRDCGYQVLEAADADEAQAIFQSGERIELIFSDIDLGKGPTGIELCRWVRRTYPATRILITSGFTDRFEDAARLCHGAFFSKPYVHQTLAAEITRLVGHPSHRP